MKTVFSQEKIAGTTILAIDVSGSMGQVTSSNSKFSRMDLAFAMAAVGSYIFEDLILSQPVAILPEKENIWYGIILGNIQTL